jgi:hypothetical protein
MRQAVLLVCALVFAACDVGADRANGAGSVGGGGGNSDGSGSMTTSCTACVDSSACTSGSCVQFGGDSYCAPPCHSDADCGSGMQCVLLTSTDAMETQSCIPRSASCSGAGCTSCPAGTMCDIGAGQCVSGGGTSGGGGGGTSGGGGTCPGYAAPTVASCCTSCSSSSSSCQTNGCYGGWYCDTTACKCHAPPTTCGSSGGGGGTGGGGGGTPTPPPTYTGSIGANGGSVSSLYFAVVGDTRPANIDGTSGYPTTIINKIYADIAAMSPQPQFVITTGDYMFASPSGSQASAQISLYMNAAHQFTTGPIFAAMGNHECTGATASNCSGSPTSNMNAYMSAMVTPLGKTLPYYTIPINDTNNTWTAKIIIAACNDWDSTQYNWLKGELAKPTTYTFVVRHEPTGTSGPPCVSEMDALLNQSTYNLFIVGHSHTFAHSGKELTVGNGGAPITGGAQYGFATITQGASGLTVTQYDYLTSQAINTFTVP